jgi:signal transduction histidine kinase
MEMRAPEEAAALLEEDVAAITHDLKNPLSVIALEVELLDGKLGDQPSQDARSALRRIARNVAFMDRIVHDLLDLSSLHCERLEMLREPASLELLLPEIVDRAVSHRDRERVCVDVRALAPVLIDVGRIERVVENLLQNALKYAPGMVIVKLDTRGTRARVSIIDSGPGMSGEEVSGLFARYHRGTGAGKQDGSGLGLYVSRKIIEAHDGRIAVDSVLGRGSQFFFELPLYAG